VIITDGVAENFHSVKIARKEDGADDMIG